MLVDNHVIVCVDGDGHFHVVKMDDRQKVMEVLKKIEDGDYYVNMLSDTEEHFPDIDKNYLSLPFWEWNQFLRCFVQRGRMEILTLENITWTV